MKFPTAKILLFLAIVIIGGVIMGAIQPLFITDLSIQSQLKDSDTATVFYTLYSNLYSHGWVVCLAIALVMFSKELKYLLLLIKSKGDN